VVVISQEVLDPSKVVVDLVDQGMVTLQEVADLGFNGQVI
jgi:hypothetical protein